MSGSPATPVADLAADDTDTAGIAASTGFTLRSRTDAPAADIAARLEVQPPVELTVTAGADPATVHLRPASPLATGATYRFRLRTASGAVAGSWAFQVKQPLHVASTLPGNEAGNVPLTTGIEITFDQDGVTGADGHIAIAPRIAGRFEQHGRTVVFVPAKPLAAATVYTVTVSHGVTMKGSDQVLADDVTFSFETRPASSAGARRYTVEIERTVIDAATGQRPVIPLMLQRDYPYQGALPTTLPVTVYRLPTVAAAVAAGRAIDSAPAWATWSSAGLVSTSGLQRVLSFDGRLQAIDEMENRAITFPSALDAGWYVIVLPVPGRDAQALLQVTDLAVYASTTETRSLAWANDIATGRPLAGADVGVAGGPHLGMTNADGLLVATTPDSLRTAASDAAPTPLPVIVVTADDGRVGLAFVGARTGSLFAPRTAETWGSRDPADRYIRVLNTDRGEFRRTDTVNVHGVVRERETGAIPPEVEVRVGTGGGADGGAGPALASAIARPDVTGLYAVSLNLVDVPYGTYPVEAWVEGMQVASTWITVADIRKPNLRADVTTDRRAYIAGEPITVTASVAFFDGTRAPGLDLTVDTWMSGSSATRRMTTGGDGVAEVALPARVGAETEGWATADIWVAPTRPEEADISAWVNPIVFEGERWLASDGSLAGTTVSVSGTVSALDRERVERSLADTGGVGDPAGAPIASARVTVTVTEEIPVRTQTGTTYDFILKRTVPVYAYSTRLHLVTSRSITSDGTGSFSLRVGVPDAGHAYRVALATTDAHGRTTHQSLTVSAAGAEPSASRRPTLGGAPACYVADIGRATYAIGDPLDLTIRDADGALPTGGSNRYLFTTSRMGLRDAVVQRTPTLLRPFVEEDVPNALVQAVWFTGHGYVPALHPVNAALDTATRRLTVTLTADRERYAPGDQVTLALRTTDAGGRPVAASAVIGVVDEKLYAMGAAAESDLLGQLYGDVGWGLLGSSVSHEVAYPAIGGCGDTTGGGGSVFRDWLLSRLVTTGPDGRASVTFPLSDDLTSWHVVASALTTDLRAGTGSLLVPVGLPFFVEAVLAPEYLVGDAPVLRLRGFGSALDAGATVRFTVDAPTLGLRGAAATAAAFADARVALPSLTPGRHDIVITGTSGTGAATMSYRLTRQVTVVQSRLTRTETTIAPLTPGWRAPAASGLASVVVTDVGRAPLVATLERLAASGGERLDQAVAAAAARRMLIEDFGRADWTLAPAEADLARYDRGNGLALLPYGGADPALTARVAITAGLDVGAGWAVLDSAVSQAASGPTVTREQAVMLLAAQAALGHDVLAAVRERAADPDLTIRERLYVAIALAELGDDAGARQIEQDLLTRYGERLGSWVRLRVGATVDDTLDATSLLALLAADLGDPIAADAEAYVAANPGHDAVFALQELGYVRRTLDRGTPAAGRFAATIDGVREVHDLAEVGSWSVTLTSAQLAALRLEPIDGALAVATSRTVPLDPSALPADPNVTLARTVAPAGTLPDDHVVRVTIVVRFGPQALSTCYQVSDVLPSGLAPLSRGGVGDVPRAEDEIAPDLVEGQRVAWCVTPTVSHRTYTLAYSARVVSPGTYLWEPATARLTVATDRIATTPPATIRIR